jgi:MFS superfamily sulfate permease-like transporter
MRDISFSFPSLSNAGKDIPAGVVVFLVALPLCLGIALASGAPLFAGVIGGVIGGIVVTLFSGSELSVSGPAAGLASIVASAIISLGSFPVFLTAIVIAGLLQIAVAAARAGSLGNFIPHSVIKGMLAAIGLTIILKQLPHAIGYDQAEFMDEIAVFSGSGWVNMVTNPLLIFESDVVHPGAVLITFVCVALIITLDSARLRDARWGKLLPSALVSVAVGTIMNTLFGVLRPEWHLTATQGQLVSLPVFASLADIGSHLVFPDLSAITRMDVWVIALTIAAIASIESVLSVEAVDNMDPLKRTSNINRELYAQGIGNTLSGLVGGIPITSVIVRSSANVYAGGRTRLSSLIHGVLLLATALLIPAVLNLIPLACLASILLIIGYKLSSITVMREMWREGTAHVVPFIVTLVAIIATDILVGVGIGLLVSVMCSYRYRNSTET